MALINCPECNREVSDQASACPHCGYMINEPALTTQGASPKKTSLGELNQSPGCGFVLIIAGAIGIIGSFMFMPFGIISLIGAFMFIVFGGTQISGNYKVNCPHCGKEISLGAKAEEIKCQYCKKQSVRKEDYLEAV